MHGLEDALNCNLFELKKDKSKVETARLLLLDLRELIGFLVTSGQTRQLNYSDLKATGILLSDISAVLVSSNRIMWF
jgi:hypothetical protein